MRRRPAWLTVHRGGIDTIDTTPMPAPAASDEELIALRDGCARATAVVRSALQLVETIRHPGSEAARRTLAAEFGAILTLLAQPPALLHADISGLERVGARLEAALAQLRLLARELQAV